MLIQGNNSTTILIIGYNNEDTSMHAFFYEEYEMFAQ